MKQIKFFLLFALCGVSVLNAQALKINSNNRVDFGNKVSINGNFSYGGIGIKVNGNIGSTASGVTTYGIFSQVEQASYSPNNTCIGVYGRAFINSTGYVPTTYVGVCGTAYAAGSNGKAVIGVAGLANTCSNSVGIYGGVVSLPTSFSFSTLYAGYFIGPVNVVGHLTATTATIGSDKRLKKNIESINNDVLGKLYSLRPIKYYLRQIERDDDSINAEGEKVFFKVKRYDEEAQYFTKLHYGLVAQELQQVYPELVYDGGDGYLEVDYIGLIPVLLQAVQQQKQETEKLQRQIDEIRNRVYTADGIFDIINDEEQTNKIPQVQTNETGNVLYQNAPNPFNVSTAIKYQLADDTQNAKICIYNLTGKQLQCYNLPATKGENSIEIRASSLQSGMYIYSLIAGDNLIASKRMILTE
ncbi:MAG: tail fiber domain-containing protein [Bacteroidales bacterium]|jgi:hypothetical protein|nr:tail fiber domain-containing protein [Bacteroidales bacterium]